MSGAGLIAKIRKQPAMLRLWSDRTLYLFGADSVPAPPALDVRINDMSEIERFEQTAAWLPRDEFIEANRRRIDSGTLVFTYAEATGPLLGFGLAHPSAPSTLYTEVDQRVVWPEKTGTIYGGFVHPSARGRGVHADVQNARIRHLIGELGMRWVVSAVASDNAAALASAAKTNLRRVADLTTRMRFGVATKTVLRRDPDFVADFQDAAE